MNGIKHHKKCNTKNPVFYEATKVNSTALKKITFSTESFSEQKGSKY